MKDDISVRTKKVKELLSIFDRVGVAPKERLTDIKEESSPATLLNNYQSVIVFAQGSSEINGGAMGEFDNYLETISAQGSVIDYLHLQEFKTVILGGDDKHVSLVKLGIESGVGGISPVDSLVVKGLGLTAKLGALVTDAPLIADDKPEKVCINCMKCLKVCPIRDTPNAKGDLSKCACGKCVDKCPV